MKNKKIHVGILSVCALCWGVFAEAQAATLENQVARAAAKVYAQHAQNYVVHITAHFKKEVLLKDCMFRSPRYPSNPNQVVSIKNTQKTCQGVVVSNRTRVIVPETCVAEDDFALKKVVLNTKDGVALTLAPEAVKIKEDIAWLTVSPEQLRSVPYVAFGRVSDSQSLQDAFGRNMTEHLKRFFRERGVYEHRRLRPGVVYSEPRLQVGEPLFYRGKLVALVKKRVRTYGGLFGGVSESALAIIR